jgi:hypothetical protein
VHRRVGDRVVVIEDQADRREVLGGEVVDQQRNDQLVQPRARAAQSRACVQADLGAHGLDRLDHVAEEAHRVVVVGVQPQPRDALLARGPGAQQRRLAESRRGREHREPASRARSQRVHQALARELLRAHRRAGELGRDDHVDHAAHPAIVDALRGRIDLGEPRPG